ncbi:unnamed protein product [Plutella xylostella]|uniref:Neutral ceramidase n=1 Tax=Plutella xylostella TaxID=51655 RepID=A0A8S4FPU5_PLUXY|nr:unnamed protein product [Plutella xylostella]
MFVRSGGCSKDNKLLGVINWFAVHPTSMNNTNTLVSSDNVGYASVLCEKELNGRNTLPGKTLSFYVDMAVALNIAAARHQLVAVHPTSMNNTNTLVSSDNVGFASVLCEKELNGRNTLPGKGSIICAFASTNLGDVSPNTRGPKCEFSGRMCDQEKLLCSLPDERCFASGPGVDMFDSTRIIATKLFEKAMEVLKGPAEDLTGEVGIVHQFVEMPTQEVAPYDPISQTFNNVRATLGLI